MQSDNLLSLKQNMKMHSKKVYSNIFTLFFTLIGNIVTEKQ